MSIDGYSLEQKSDLDNNGGRVGRLGRAGCRRGRGVGNIRLQ